MSDAQINEFDIVIAGAGMVGASLACLLAESSLRIALIDRKPLVQYKGNDSSELPSDNFDPRVSAISQSIAATLSTAWSLGGHGICPRL